MIAFTRILVPTNLGEPSKAAIKFGVALARQFDAKLFLLHVLRNEDYDAVIEAERVLEKLVPEAEPGEPNPEEVVRTVARADLQQLLNPYDERATGAEYLLRPVGTMGAPAAIADCARQIGIDLIVMGKHGLSRIEHMLGGSVTEKVVGLSACPVMVVKHPGQAQALQEAFTEVVEY